MQMILKKIDKINEYFYNYEKYYYLINGNFSRNGGIADLKDFELEKLIKIELKHGVLEVFEIMDDEFEKIEYKNIAEK